MIYIYTYIQMIGVCIYKIYVYIKSIVFKQGDSPLPTPPLFAISGDVFGHNLGRGCY